MTVFCKDFIAGGLVGGPVPVNFLDMKVIRIVQKEDCERTIAKPMKDDLGRDIVVYVSKEDIRKEVKARVRFFNALIEKHRLRAKIKFQRSTWQPLKLSKEDA